MSKYYFHFKEYITRSLLVKFNQALEKRAFLFESYK